MFLGTGKRELFNEELEDDAAVPNGAPKLFRFAFELRRLILVLFEDVVGLLLKVGIELFRFLLSLVILKLSLNSLAASLLRSDIEAPRLPL